MFGIDDALILGGASFLGGAMANQSRAGSAQSANDFSAAQFATRYQTTVKDMEAAGLNPMLAYNQGGGSPPTGVSYTAQNPMEGVASAYSTGAVADAQRGQLEASAMASRASAWNTAAQTELVNQQSKKIVAELEAGAPQAKADLDRSNIELNSLKGDQLYAMSKMLYTQADLNKQKGLTEQQQRNVMYETIQKIQSETQLLEYDVKAAKDLGNIGREFTQLKPIVDVLLRVMRK